MLAEPPTLDMTYEEAVKTIAVGRYRHFKGKQVMSDSDLALLYQVES